MKRPWINFIGICTLVLGIVLFCVVFGGYSSLHRSRNRIHTVHQMLTEQCAAQVALAKRMAQTDGSDRFRDLTPTLSRNARKLKAVLLRMTVSQDPMPVDLIQDFEIAQADLHRQLSALITQIKTDRIFSPEEIKDMEKRQAETNTAVVVMIRQYNKEARYFNSRSRQFPGMLIARLFNMDHLLFPEIEPPSILSGDAASAT